MEKPSDGSSDPSAKKANGPLVLTAARHLVEPLASQQAPDPLTIYPGHRQVFVKATANSFCFLASQVATPPLQPAQLAAASDFESFCRCFVCLYLGHNLSPMIVTVPPPFALLEPPLAPLLPPAAIALSPLRLAQSNTPLLTVRDEKALLSYVAQHTLSLHRLSKALEQLLL